LLSAFDFLLTYVALPLVGVLGAIATVHGLEQGLLPTSWRAHLTRLLASKRNKSAEQVTVGDAMLAATDFFDYLFGERHWTLRCFFVSSIVTVLFSAISFAAIYFMRKLVFVFIF
jgi:hypothetical protein